LIEFGLLVLDKNFFLFQCTFTLLLLSLLGEQSPSFEQTLIPFPPKDDLRQVWLKIGPVVLEKKSKMLKFTDRQRDRRTDDGQQVSLELSAQVS
jgi:hypothetical protein